MCILHAFPFKVNGGLTVRTGSVTSRESQPELHLLSMRQTSEHHVARVVAGECGGTRRSGMHRRTISSKTWLRSPCHAETVLEPYLSIRGWATAHGAVLVVSLFVVLLRFPLCVCFGCFFVCCFAMFPLMSVFWLIFCLLFC